MKTKTLAITLLLLITTLKSYSQGKKFNDDSIDGKRFLYGQVEGSIKQSTTIDFISDTSIFFRIKNHDSIRNNSIELTGNAYLSSDSEIETDGDKNGFFCKSYVTSDSCWIEFRIESEKFEKLKITHNYCKEFLDKSIPIRTLKWQKRINKTEN